MATAETHPAIRNSRVLVASSNESFRRLWVEKPEYETVEMEEAAGGADALAKLESENWGEVLLDRHLHDRVVDSDFCAVEVEEPPRIIAPAAFGPGMQLDREVSFFPAAVPIEDLQRNI